MPPKRNKSWPPTPQIDLIDKNLKGIDKKLRKVKEFLMVREANIRLEMNGYDPSTGLPNGVTQGEFDHANEDYRKKKKSDTACSQVAVSNPSS